MDAVRLSLVASGLVILLAIIVILVAQRTSRGSARDGELPTQDPAHEDTATLHVVALGVKGSGKTVLLASQFHELNQPAHNRGYVLVGDDVKQDRSLAAIYEKVSNTDAPWPPGTQIGDTREFGFDCRARDGSGAEQSVFRISYVDFAGDLLEPGDQEYDAAAWLEERVDRAHALLVIIDGGRVLDLLHNRPAGHNHFDCQLMPLFRLAARASCPLQLIITKWDLVRAFRNDEPMDDDALLREVRERLLAYPLVSELVRSHCDRQETVRLIPVSAVGPQFAELRLDGEVGKRADGRIDPFKIDAPLCAVLPDVLSQLEDSLDPAVRRKLEADIDRHRTSDTATIVVSVLDSAAGQALRATLVGRIGDALVRLFIEMMVRRRRAPRIDALNGDDEAQAQRLRADVLKDMERVVWLLQERLPSSILCGRR